MHILITGPPRIGKTTLIESIIEKLNKMKVRYAGFITREIREYGNRVGFSIETFPDRKKAILAHIRSNSKKRVGKYGVNTEEFEKIALPSISRRKTQIVIVDEIGSMELFSERFREEIYKLLKESHPIILATIQLKQLSILGDRKIKSFYLFEMFTDTRDYIFDKVLTAIENELGYNNTQ